MGKVLHIIAEAIKYLILCGLAVGVYKVLPPDMKPSLRMLSATKPLETVTLEQAIARQDESRGAVTVSFLYLSALPPQVAGDLVRDVRQWKKSGVAVHAFSIDPVPDRTSVAKYLRNIGLDVSPVWIRMPEGDQCAFEQLRAADAFRGLATPELGEIIPLLTLILRDRNGKVVRTQSVSVPNGEALDPSQFDQALYSFETRVRSTLRGSG